jgi:hypothetical protein
MARTDSTRKPTKTRTREPDPDLLKHILCLGLADVDD